MDLDDELTAMAARPEEERVDAENKLYYHMRMAARARERLATGRWEIRVWRGFFFALLVTYW